MLALDVAHLVHCISSRVRFAHAVCQLYGGVLWGSKIAGMAVKCRVPFHFVWAECTGPLEWAMTSTIFDGQDFELERICLEDSTIAQSCMYLEMHAHTHTHTHT